MGRMEILVGIQEAPVTEEGQEDDGTEETDEEVAEKGTENPADTPEAPVAEEWAVLTFH
ncbi:hypothetical protein R4Z09_20825 [Niallia oryzisoli]|uniref:Uncharacterized protein n=1 Tax=Niallia oryzisoli TaxID=1737571 RepID=A0ABZ2CD00_9BACI